MSNTKTNAMRLLDSAGISYNHYEYDYSDGFIDGVSVAKKTGMPVEKVFKTLVAQGISRNYYVFIIPVAEELNLKAAAKAVGEKAVEMIRVANINKVTGYIRGGCSPLGMKKTYRTVIDSTSELLDSIVVSAGKLGLQIELSPTDLIHVVPCDVADITA